MSTRDPVSMSSTARRLRVVRVSLEFQRLGVLGFLGVLAVFLILVVTDGFPREDAWLLGLGGLGYGASLIGAVIASFTPPAVGGRGLALSSMACGAAFGLTLIGMGLEVPGLGPGAGVGRVIAISGLFFIGRMLFLRYLSRLARYLERPNQASALLWTTFFSALVQALVYSLILMDEWDAPSVLVAISSLLLVLLLPLYFLAEGTHFSLLRRAIARHRDVVVEDVFE